MQLYSMEMSDMAASVQPLSTFYGIAWSCSLITSSNGSTQTAILGDHNVHV